MKPLPEEIYALCQAALHEFGKLTEAYLMRKLKIDWKNAKSIIERFHYQKGT